MDFAAHIEDQFSWLLTMARNPGFKAQAWHRANELQASDPMYAGFPQRLKAAMRSESSPPSEPAADRTTASTGQPRRGA